MGIGLMKYGRENKGGFSNANKTKAITSAKLS
jgi:hypothetical protein